MGGLGVVDVWSHRTDGRRGRLALANLSIALVGEILYETMKEAMGDSDKRDFRAQIDRADSQAMLEWSLRFAQLAKL